MKKLLTLVAVIVSGAAAYANDGAITGVGGTIQLLDEHPSISLIAEHVHARVFVAENAIETECLFVLVNNGPPVKATIGFPEFYGGDTGPVPFDYFRSFVDGELTACTRVVGNSGSGGNIEHWWTKDVEFGAGQVRTIRDVYRSPAGHSVSVGPDSPICTFEYTLYTGASWAGEIGSATVVVSFEGCPPEWSPHLRPSPTFTNGCDYTWNVRQFEPGASGPAYINVQWPGPATVFK